ncbi:MAG: hypothetical protein LBU18_04480 [Treponema sp.]|nr:hypothetical protein [Treponema sp.]
MKTDTNAEDLQGRRNPGLLRFLVLVPHRDSRRLLEARRSTLFAAGFLGSWSFPAAAPLARLTRPMTASKLKAIAASLRDATLSGGRDGKIAARAPAVVQCPGIDIGLHFWGPVLDLPVPTEQTDMDYLPFSAAVLCAALTPDGLSASLSLPSLPAFSFRAAAVANITLIPLNQGAAGYSFRWRIGPLFWLPKKQHGL